MKDSIIIKTGIAGSIIAAICCFTPALVVLLGAVGLSAWLGWLDYALFLAMILFLGLIGWGLWQRKHAAACCEPAASKMKDA